MYRSSYSSYASANNCTFHGNLPADKRCCDYCCVVDANRLPTSTVTSPAPESREMVPAQASSSKAELKQTVHRLMDQAEDGITICDCGSRLATLRNNPRGRELPKIRATSIVYDHFRMTGCPENKRFHEAKPANRVLPCNGKTVSQSTYYVHIRGCQKPQCQNVKANKNKGD